MLMRISKVVLLVAFLAAFVASGTAAYGGSRACGCYFVKDFRLIHAPGGCQFDKSTSQCVSVNCSGGCF